MNGGMELERRPMQQQQLMLKEWLELESIAELSRDGFGCYPRHLAAELRSASGRRRNGDVIARLSAAVRAALSRPTPAGREREAAALARSRSLSGRLRAGFWKKRRSGQAEDTDMAPVASCSATAGSSGRRDAPSPAMSPHRVSREGRQAGGDGAGHLSAGRRSHEAVVVKGCECENETTCRLEEREQRLSPVSVMDFLSQDGDDDGNDDDCNDPGGGSGPSEDDGASPTFEQSLANIRRASQQLLQRIRRFEQLAELDTSDADDTTTTADDATTSCHVEDLDSTGDEEDADGARQLFGQGLPEAISPSPCAAAPCFRRLLQDFFREGLSSSCVPEDPDLERSLLEAAKAWVDGRHRALGSDGKAEVEEIERLGRWRRFREDEQELLGCDVEGGIFWSLVEELIHDLR